MHVGRSEYGSPSIKHGPAHSFVPLRRLDVLAVIKSPQSEGIAD